VVGIQCRAATKLPARTLRRDELSRPGPRADADQTGSPFGLLFETVPRVTLVPKAGVFAPVEAFLFGRAVRAGRWVAVIGTWLLRLAAGVAACVAFARFVHAGPAATDVTRLPSWGLLAFMATHSLQHATVRGSVVIGWCTAAQRDLRTGWS
jgi:hypothetical protein